MRHISNALLLVGPFLLLVAVNEYARPLVNSAGHALRGQATMNPGGRDPDACTWICHDVTAYCQEHHVKLPTSVLPFTDIPYDGTIALLSLGGAYGAACLLVLVVAAPLTFWYLTVRILGMQREISALKAKPV